MAFIRFGVVVKLFKFFVSPFLSPYAHPGLKYVHLNRIFILPTKQNQDKGEKTFFWCYLVVAAGYDWWSHYLPKKASVSQKVSVSAGF